MCPTTTLTPTAFARPDQTSQDRPVAGRTDLRLIPAQPGAIMSPQPLEATARAVRPRPTDDPRRR
eukprot:4439010-Alexandrium_andersonii.AAC.1